MSHHGWRALCNLLLPMRPITGLRAHGHAALRACGYRSAYMLAVAALIWTLAAASARAENIILVPIDSRPPGGQFPEMIAAMADSKITIAPERYLGQFLTPGSPEAIMTWLESQDMSNVASLVVSTDMIAYGGLISSRINSISADKAINRLQRLARIRKKWPNLKIYGFSAVMRLAPTATRTSAAWRLLVSKHEELTDRYRTKPSVYLKKRIASLKSRIPAGEIEGYRAARKRNHLVQRYLVTAAANGAFDYLLIGQDDASPYGPHKPETATLRNLVDKLGAHHRVLFCQGIDQHAAILVSRSILASQGWTPRVSVVFSDPAAASKIAMYESKPLGASLKEQVVASGAVLAQNSQDSDYTLYINTPKSRPETRQRFLKWLGQDIDRGLPVAVADVNLGKDGTCDPALFETLYSNGRMMKVLAFAGWNSPGNTMGTTIPAANVYLMARRANIDPLKRETAQRAFLLHRFVNDYAYQTFTRPVAYNLLDSRYLMSREEVYGTTYSELTDFVRRDLGKHLERYFRDQFQGRQFFAGTRSYVFTGLDEVSISLPWPRAYEVSLRFKMRAQETAVQGN